jgi:hypothetical protein
MAGSALNRCDIHREWAIEELAVLFDEHVTGLDFDLLASRFDVPVKEIWHQLAHLYFDTCLSKSEPPAPNHLKRWSVHEEAELNRLYLDNVAPVEMSKRLVRCTSANRCGFSSH